MLKRLLLFVTASLASLMASAVTFTYDKVDTANHTCRISGIDSHTDLPATLTLPSTCYTSGVVCSVTAIAPNALNDLPGVTIINIPHSIEVIGDHQTDILSSDLANFLNCPDLTTFYVGTGNAVYASTSGGLLVTKDGGTLLRCPAKVPTNNGLYVMPKEITYFPVYSFAGVTTISSIQFDELTYIEGGSGLNLMPNLSTIILNGNAGRYYKLVNGVLYSKNGEELISFPPRKMEGTFAIPSGVKVLNRFSFANTIYLSQISFPASVTDIRKATFLNSSLRSLTIPATVTRLQPYVCSECKQLTTLTFRNAVENLPECFAADCPKLTTVAYDKLPAEIFDAAFRNCTSLVNHPMTASIIYGDSTFYNTGFTKIVYDNAPVSTHSTWPGSYIFGGCKKLTSIDMSAVDTSDKYCWIGGYLAPDCPLLTEVSYPQRSFILQPGWNTGNSLAFGNACHINKVVLHQFARQGSLPVFSWFSSYAVRPNIYLKLNGTGDQAGAATHNLCTGYDGTVVKPIYYYERYAPLDKYVDSNASYYVPGGCLSYFQEAVDAGCYVEEMFRLRNYADEKGYFTVELKEVYPDMIELVSLRVNNQEIALKNYGTIPTAIPYQYVQEFEMKYKAHGELLTTTYPGSLFLGVDDVTVDANDAEPEYFDLFGRRVDAPCAGNIYVVRRGTEVTKQLVR